MRKALVLLLLVFLITACSPRLPANGEFTAEINGVDLWYKVAGQGTQVLFVQPPAQGTGVDLFILSMTPLEQDFKVVYYDPRGSGQSERDPDPETLNIGQVIEDIEALRLHLGIEEFALMGQSNGALVSLNYAEKYPEHLTHLILTNEGIGTAEDYTPTMMGEMAQQEKYQAALGALGDMSTVVDDVTFTDWFKVAAPVYFWNVEWCDEYTAGIPAGSAAFDLETFGAISATKDQYEAVFDNLGAINIPTLVVAGDRDFSVSVEAAQTLASRLPNAELIVLDHTNHMPTIDNPDDFFPQLTAFLNR